MKSWCETADLFKSISTDLFLLENSLFMCVGLIPGNKAGCYSLSVDGIKGPGVVWIITIDI